MKKILTSIVIAIIVILVGLFAMFWLADDLAGRWQVSEQETIYLTLKEST